MRLPLRARLPIILNGTVTTLLLSVSTARAQSSDGLIITSRLPELIAILLCALAIGGATLWVRRYGLPRLRSLPPLEAVGDAVGRATEQGVRAVRHPSGSPWAATLACETAFDNRPGSQYNHIVI